MQNNIVDIDQKPDDYYSCSREEMLKFIPTGISRVLEIGCAEGYFGQILKSRFAVEVWGVENMPKAVEEARGRLDKVLLGDIEKGEVDLPTNYFDCIIFNDVLEHFQYPWKQLRSLRKYLKDGGYVVSSIPNVRHFENMKNLLIKKKWEYVDSGILDRTHLRFFTSKSIKEMFEISGYDVVSIDGINGGKFPWKFGLLNVVFLNLLNDMRYLQFACVARKADE